MRKLILILSLFIITNGYGQDSLNAIDSSTKSISEKGWEVSGVFLTTNNAFAPIPAFSFDDPAIMSFLSIKKNRWKYEPDFSIGLTGKPWMWNNWFRYGLVKKQSLNVYVGVNPTLFFISSKTEQGDELIEAHRNLTGELSVIWHQNAKLKNILTYRYNQAFDFGTISGHFVDFSVEISEVFAVNDIYVNLRPQLFYFNNERDTDGLFVANTLQVGHKKVPLMLAYQSVQSIWTNFLSRAKYNHNVSLIYLL